MNKLPLDFSDLSVVVVYIVLFLLYVLSFFFGITVLPLDLLYLVLPFCVVFFGARTVFLLGMKSKASAPIVFILIGFLLFSLGELTWFVLDKALHIDPFPSIADIFFISAYPFLFVGFLKKANQDDFLRKNIALLPALTLILIGGVVSVFVVYMGVYLVSLDYLPFTTVFFSVLYGVADVLLTMIAVTAVVVSSQYHGGALFKVWVLLAGGMFVFLVADVLFIRFSYDYQNGTEIYHLIDLFWLLSYTLSALGLNQFMKIVKKINSKVKALK